MEKNYNCARHGNIGDPDCQACRDNLRKLALDKGAVLFNEEGICQT